MGKVVVLYSDGQNVSYDDIQYVTEFGRGGLLLVEVEGGRVFVAPGMWTTAEFWPEKEEE